MDANLIEEEPYNCLAQLKNKMTKVAQQNSNILEILETSFLSPPKAQNERRQWGPVRCHRQTVFFASNHLPVGQKTSLVNFKHKITTSANYTDSIGIQDLLLMTKNCVCKVKDSKTTSKSINRIRPVLMP